MFFFFFFTPKNIICHLLKSPVTFHIAKYIAEKQNINVSFRYDSFWQSRSNDIFITLDYHVMVDIGRCDCIIVHVVEPCVCLVQWSGEQNYRNRSWLALLVLFWIGAKSLNSSTPKGSRFLSWMRLMSWLLHRAIKTRAFVSRGTWFPS